MDQRLRSCLDNLLTIRLVAIQHIYRVADIKPPLAGSRIAVCIRRSRKPMFRHEFRQDALTDPDIDRILNLGHLPLVLTDLPDNRRDVGDVCVIRLLMLIREYADALVVAEVHQVVQPGRVHVINADISVFTVLSLNIHPGTDVFTVIVDRKRLKVIADRDTDNLVPVLQQLYADRHLIRIKDRPRPEDVADPRDQRQRTFLAAAGNGPDLLRDSILLKHRVDLADCPFRAGQHLTQQIIDRSDTVCIIEDLVDVLCPQESRNAFTVKCTDDAVTALAFLRSLRHEPVVFITLCQANNIFILQICPAEVDLLPLYVLAVAPFVFFLNGLPVHGKEVLPVEFAGNIVDPDLVRNAEVQEINSVDRFLVMNTERLADQIVLRVIQITQLVSFVVVHRYIVMYVCHMFRHLVPL